MSKNLPYSKSQQLRQAALLIEALPKSDAVKLLARLEPDQVKAVFAAFRTIDSSDRGELAAAVARFSQAATTRQSIKRDHISEVSLPIAKKVLPDPDGEATKKPHPFDFLINADHHLRVIALETVSPKDIAIVLSSLPPKTSSATLASLSNQQQRCDVMRQLCFIGEITESDLVELRFSIGQNLKRVLVAATAVAEEQLALTDSSADIVDDANQRSMTTIERLDALSDEQIKTIMQSCDTSLWAPALKNAPTRVREKIFNCMASVPASLLKLEIQQLPSVNDIDEVIARQQIVKTVFDLASNGQILIGQKAA
jgi:flagellar motor switch protein FliG